MRNQKKMELRKNIDLHKHGGKQTENDQNFDY